MTSGETRDGEGGKLEEPRRTERIKKDVGSFPR